MKRKIVTKKRLAGAVALVAAAAIFMGGTFAYNDFEQHATNPFAGGEQVEVRLNDKFDPPKDWSMNDPIINKDVSVTNTRETGSPVYVRLQFKEYLEETPLTDVVATADNVNTDWADPAHPLYEAYEVGEPLLFATYADGADIGKFILWDTLADKTGYLKYAVDVNNTKGDTTDDINYTLTTNSQLKNGVYGAFMRIGGLNSEVYLYDENANNDAPSSGSDDDLAPTKTTFISENHNGQGVGGGGSTPECIYPTHEWPDVTDTNADEFADWSVVPPNIPTDGSQNFTTALEVLKRAPNCEYEEPGHTHNVHDHIQWNLGQDGAGANIKTLAEWADAAGNNKALGNFWVVCPDGWAYWGNALAPETTTAKIMDSVELMTMPDDRFEYQLHIDMEAVSAGELDAFKYNNGAAYLSGTAGEMISEPREMELINRLGLGNNAGSVTPGENPDDTDDAVTTTLERTNSNGTSYKLTTNEAGEITDVSNIIMIGMDGDPSTTHDNNMLLSPAGSTILSNVKVRFTEAEALVIGETTYQNPTGVLNAEPVVDLGNGFVLTAGEDNYIGSLDDIVQTITSTAVSTDETNAYNEPVAFGAWSGEDMAWRLLDVNGSGVINGSAVIVSDYVLDDVMYSNQQAGELLNTLLTNDESLLNGVISSLGSLVNFVLSLLGFNPTLAEKAEAILPTLLNALDLDETDLLIESWDKSSYNSWLNGTGDFTAEGFLTNAFTATPDAIDKILSRNADTESLIGLELSLLNLDDLGLELVPMSTLSSKIWALSVEEAAYYLGQNANGTIRTNFGTITTPGTPAEWLTRSTTGLLNVELLGSLQLAGAAVSTQTDGTVNNVAPNYLTGSLPAMIISLNASITDASVTP